MKLRQIKRTQTAGDCSSRGLVPRPAAKLDFIPSYVVLELLLVCKHRQREYAKLNDAAFSHFNWRPKPW